MLQRDESGATPSVLSAHGFLMEVVVDQKGPSAERITELIADALQWVEGTGKVSIEYLGPMEFEDNEDSEG